MFPTLQVMHVYEVRPRKDKRGVDLISDVLPFGRLWYGDTNAVVNAIGYAEHFSRSHNAVIRVYDAAGNVIETHQPPQRRFQRVVARFYSRLRATCDFHQQFQRDVPSLNDRMKSHGRGAGVGRERGVGVGLGVGVGVEPACTSKEPISMRPFLTRKKSGPR